MVDVQQNNDPFSMVYAALWQLVERNQQLQDVLKEANQIKFDENNSPKANVSDADLPEMSLLCGGGSFTGRIDTTNTKVTKEYIWAITTGTYRVNEVYNRLSWELFRSLSDWQCVLCELQWCGCNFVKDLRLTTAEEGTLMQELNRGVAGWAALWNCEVDFVIPLKKLKIQ